MSLRTLLKLVINKSHYICFHSYVHNLQYFYALCLYQTSHKERCKVASVLT